MKLADIRATTVSVPLEPPPRHANGCQWARFVRTIVEVETDDGVVGLGEMGSGGEPAEAAFRALKPYLRRPRLLAALEFACLDIWGQAWAVPVCDILGGRLRDRVPFASYLFFRYANPRTGAGAGAGREIGPRKTARVPRTVSKAGPLSLRSGPAAAGLAASHSERPLGRAGDARAPRIPF